MRIVKWSKSEVSRDPKNPLVDLHPDDDGWYFDTLVSMTGEISRQAQLKDEYVWEQLAKRRPKHLHKGKDGPNSVLSVVTGLLANYLENTAKYGGCRISRKQQEDFEFVCLLFNAINSEQFDTVQWQECLFSQGGVTF